MRRLVSLWGGSPSLISHEEGSLEVGLTEGKQCLMPRFACL